MSPGLGPEQRSALLAVARSALVRFVGGHPPLPKGDPAAAAEPVSVFVTLRRGKKLRGCIGVLESPCSHAEAVTRCALSAARDPRFPALDAKELPEIQVEVSVLGPRTTITDPREVRIGLDGLIVTDGTRRGVLLPQVAVDQGWDGRRFLEETCLKAGLARDAWAGSAEVRAFTAEVFAEAGSGGPGPDEPAPT